MFSPAGGHQSDQAGQSRDDNPAAQTAAAPLARRRGLLGDFYQIIEVAPELIEREADPEQPAEFRR